MLGAKADTVLAPNTEDTTQEKHTHGCVLWLQYLACRRLYGIDDVVICWNVTITPTKDATMLTGVQVCSTRISLGKSFILQQR